MTAIAYKYYRLLVSEVQQANYYLGVEEFCLYEGILPTSENLALTAIATARTNYNASTNPVSNVKDNSRSTWWASAQMTAGVDEWLKLELPTPKVVRRFEVHSAFNKQESPRKYKLQGSNDDLNWTTIYKESDNRVEPILRNLSHAKVSGSSKNTSGSANPRVIVSHWESGGLIDIVTPNPDGSFACYTQTESQVLVTHIGPPGTQPKSDGPITPYE